MLGRKASEYVYACGLDYNWRDSFSDTVEDPTKLYLARVRKDRIMDRSAWEFLAGRPGGRPTWTRSLDQGVPVLEDDRRVYPTFRGEGISNMTVLSQGSIVYNAPLERYIYASWTEYTWEFYEAERPQGPWKLQLLAAQGPRRARGSQPAGERSGSGRNLAVSGAGVTPIEKSAHYGNEEYLNDGVRSHSEDSWDRENKPLDFWGYTWTRNHRLDRLVYTTGTMFPNGGWFSAEDGGIRVQVRREFRWRDVKGLRISPEYPYDSSAGSNRTYTLDFHDTWGDGVRIIGRPGGTEYFTSVAELEAYYARRGRNR